MFADSRAALRLLLGGLALLLVAAGQAPEALAQKKIFARVEPNPEGTTEKLTFDVNVDATDNIAPNIVLSKDAKRGFVSYTGSGIVLVFSMETGEILARIKTEGKPAFATVLPDGRTMVVVSVLENKIFTIDMDAMKLLQTFTFTGAQFGFGSAVAVSADGTTGYVSSTGTGEVIKFSIADGKESGRLKNLQGPARIVIAADGTLLVVDTLTEEVLFVDPSTLALKSYKVKTKDKEPLANLTLFNAPVFSPDGTTAIIASRDVNGTLGADTAFHFNVSSGEILDTAVVGSEPGFTGTTPDQKYWVVYSEFSLTLISTTDFKSVRELSLPKGEPLGSSNVLFSSDSKFAFYAAAQDDVVLQHNLDTNAVVGQVLVGDDPDSALDQPSTLAMTPDGKVIAVLDFVSNNIELLEDAFVLDAAKFISSSEKFTGLSLINLSNTTSKYSIKALDNYGDPITGEGITNPVEVELPPNNQISETVAELFGFDDATEQVGWLTISGDQPKTAGYVTYGDTTLARLDGAALFEAPLFDWIAPEIVSTPGTKVELNFVNPNFNQGTYRLQRFSDTGAVKETTESNTAFPTNRQPQVFDETFLEGVTATVVFAGGELGTSSTESYDTNTAQFTSNDATLSVERRRHTATTLQSGKLLIAGGTDGTTTFDTADVYDPATGGFTALDGKMISRRSLHTATLLPNGNVLLTGGTNGSDILSSAEVYDPTTRTFTATGSMTLARKNHTATLLRNGRVLIAGGEAPGVTIAAELYDPATGKFTATGNLAVARTSHSATLLNDGRVLVAGGSDATDAIDTAEIYDVAAGGFYLTAGGMTSVRSGHTATLIPGGKVLLAGGRRSDGAISSGDVFDPATDTFTAPTNSLTTARFSHTATLLPEGTVLIAGGTSDGTASLNSVESYDPTANTFSPAGSLGAGRLGQTATLVPHPAGGYLRLDTKSGMIFNEIVTGANSISALNGIDLKKFEGISRIYSPRFAVLPGWTTILNVINPTTEEVEVTITLHDSSGAVIGTPVKKTIPSNGQLKGNLVSLFADAPEVRDVAGWLKVESTLDPIVGTVTLTNDLETFEATFQLQGTPETSFLFPVVGEDDVYATGTALLNPNDDPTQVTVELWGSGGSLDRTTTFTLGPRESLARFLGGYFPNLEPRLVGNIRIRSERPLYGVGIIADRDLTFLLAIPPVRMP